MYSLLMHDGWQMLIDDSHSILAKRRGKFETAKQWFINKYLRDNHTFFDVGAAEGFFTLFAAKRLSDSGQVIAVEPEFDNLKTLKVNKLLNGYRNVVIIDYAVSREMSSAKLWLADNHIGGHSLVPNLKGRSKRFAWVETTTLDDLARTFDVPDFLKIDVEGHEMGVLAGAEFTLSHPQLKYIAMDVHPSLGVEIPAVQALLKAYGFNMAEVKGQHNELFAIRPKGKSPRKRAGDLTEKP